MSQIKSRDRVRDLAEVYTNEREVNAMLDLIPLKKPDDIITYKYLEPACGNGNFLIEILARKLKRVNEKYAEKSLSVFEFYMIRAMTGIYGIDICGENVEEAIERLLTYVKSNFSLQKGGYIPSEGYFSLVEYVLRKNIVQGDSINGADKIELTEFVVIKGRSFEQRVFRFDTLTQKAPAPVRVIPAQHFLDIGKQYRIEQGCDNHTGQVLMPL